jgi:2-polyprenyl-6-methoxyphenol hydroxylase-like FAD-dependent oxidoreductase
LSRSDLDTLIVEKAAELPSITLHQDEEVVKISKVDQHWVVETAVVVLKSRFLVIGAGAAAAGLARGFIRERKSPSDRVGYTLSATISGGELPKLVTLIPLRGGELYVTRLSQTLANVSLVGAPSFIQTHRTKKDLDALLSDSLGVAVCVSEKGIGASHFEARHESLDPQLYLVGDAVESFDPACGMGMSHALASGISAAEKIQQVLLGKKPAATVFSEYEHEHEVSARGLRRYSASIRRVLWLYQRSPFLFAPLSGSLAGRGVVLLEAITKPLRDAYR